ncbi:SAM-dependent methyltransferase [Parasediminibacterium sp. JCM 36343]|uniref:SAM-dependent methyltransferase n=1 Tax=Parasediminibacterium sp. JCM 36343 TaxID=3374279 RepID=UPI00397C1F54
MVYLIPIFLHEDAIETIPAYILDAVKQSTVFFVENEKTARRYLKRLWKEMVIDDYQWYTIHKAEDQVLQAFAKHVLLGQNIGIISEAGCPGIADPGQVLVNKAQQMGAPVKPLVGPSSILLALMASGMNGQQFRFNGYLPVDNMERKNAIKALEASSLKSNCTEIFIETPYRNNPLIKELLQTCKETTLLCIAVDITAPSETIQTKTIKQWKQLNLDFHKRLAIFLLLGG